MAVLSVLRKRLGILLAVAVALVTLAGVAALPQPPGGHPAVVSLAGTPHLWFSDSAGQLHWGGDTRALAGRWIPWSNRIEISKEELCALPPDRLGDPWLSAGLVKQGDPIYLVKWETDWAQPKLLHIRSLRDVEALGINERNYGYLVYDVPTWEARYGFSVAALERGVMAPVCAPPPTPAPTATPTATPTSGSTAAPPAPSAARPGLTVSNIGRDRATLTITNHTGSWYYQYTAPAGGTCSGEQTDTTVTVTGLNPNVAYTFQVYSDVTCAMALATAGSFTTPEKSLTWSGLTATKVTLNIAGHSNIEWWYKADKAPHSGCDNSVSAGTSDVDLSGLLMNTSYKYTAYSDNTCSTVIAATERFTTLNPRLAASAVTATTATLTISGWVPSTDGGWYYQADKVPHNAGCASIVPTTTVNLSGLSVNTRYTYTAYTDSNCSTASKIAASTFTTKNPALAATARGAITATLTLSGWDVSKDGNWYYKRTSPSGDDTCHQVSSATTVDLTGLSKSTSYTYAAYSDSGCTTANLLSTASAFTTRTPALAAAQSADDVTLTLTNWTHADGDWYYQDDQNQSCSSDAVSPPSSGTTSTTTVANVLTATSTTYVFTAYSDSSCTTANLQATAPGLTPVKTLTAGNIGATFADLTLDLYSGQTWYYKANKAPHTSCTSNQGNTPVRLNGLTTNTRYTYTAYSDTGCNTVIVAAKPFTTLTPSLTVSSVGATGAILTIANWDTGRDSPWYYKRTSPSGDNTCHQEGGAVARLTGLTKSTSYKYTAYSDTGCSKVMVAAAFTTLTPSLAASNVGATTATLTISGWITGEGDGTWYYKRTSPSGDATCHERAAATASLTGLTKNTAYTYAAYSDSGCTTANLLATASAFTTLTPSLAASNVGSTTATLTISGWTTGDGGDGSWYYKRTSPSGDNTCHEVSSGSTASLTGLTKNTAYTYAAYSDSGCTTANLQATASAFTTLNASLTTTKGAFAVKLTLTGWTGNWYYKHASGTCSSSAVTGSSVTVTGLTKTTNYTYTAYHDSGCINEIVAGSQVTTLTPSMVGRKGDNNPLFGLTLVLSGYVIAIDGPWWYRELKTEGSPALDRCTSGGNSLTHHTFGLTRNSVYTVSAHTATACTSASKIAEVTGIRTDT